MNEFSISRRNLLIGTSALAAGSAFSTQVLSAAPPASAVTPQLIGATISPLDQLDRQPGAHPKRGRK